MRILIILILSLILVGCSSKTITEDEDLGICENISTCGVDNENQQLEVACPFGHVEEPFLGTCGRYIDTDKNQICDLSQPK